MNRLKHFFERLRGGDGENAIKLAKKDKEAIRIKKGMNQDISDIKKKVDKLNKNTNTKLREISSDLKDISVTYQIAKTTGRLKT